MQLSTIDTNRVKIEARNYPAPEGPKTGSKFWKVVQGFGALASPVGFATSLFFPPAVIAGAGGLAAYQYGSYKDAMKQQAIMKQEQTRAAAPVTFYPGINTPVGGPGSFPVNQQVSDPMNLISNGVLPNRNAMTRDMTGQIGQGE